MPHTAKTYYKKEAGTLELTSSNLQWTRDGEETSSLSISLVDANALFCSKDGASQIKLKLALRNDEQGHNFIFVSNNALAERETFKKELTAVIGKNRTKDTGKTVTAASTSQSKAELLYQRSATNTPGLPSRPSREGTVSRRASATPQTPGFAPEDFRLCKRVLMKNAELATLHKQLVITGQISEAEFWEGRQSLLRAEHANERQRQGRPGTLVDPRPETLPNGEIKIVITPQLVHDIFDEFPIVAQAYSDNVPSKLTEASFWQRYFQSKLFFSHQASIRSAATQHVVKGDTIFDQYLQQTDDGLQPLRAHEGVHSKVIDLAATEEDHTVTGNALDVTMHAGKQKAVLPLIRRFNEHSERLLQASNGDAPAAKQQPLPETAEVPVYLEHLDLADLHDTPGARELPLNIGENQRLFESTSRISASRLVRSDFLESLDSIQQGLAEWCHNLSQLDLDKKASDAAVLQMTEGVQAKLAIQLDSVEPPDQLLAQMSTCQTAANEFLRQFWVSIFPTVQDMRNPGFSKSSEQREAKAVKMVAYLETTREKVEALLPLARQLDVDPAMVETAMQPLMTSVQHAVKFYRHRKDSTRS